MTSALGFTKPRQHTPLHVAGSHVRAALQTQRILFLTLLAKHNSLPSTLMENQPSFSFSLVADILTCLAKACVGSLQRQFRQSLTSPKALPTPV